MAIGLDIREGDVVISPSGKLKTVSGSKKVYKDLGKYLLTTPEHEDNITTYTRYNPNYGCTVNIKTYYSDIKSNRVLGVINNLLNQDLNNYITLQSNRNNISIDESISYLDMMAVFSSTAKSTVNIIIQAILVSGDTVDMGTYTQELI